MFEALFIFQQVSLILFRAARSCLFAATFKIVVTLLELSGVTTNWIQGITLSKLSFLAFFSWSIFEKNQPSSITLLLTDTDWIQWVLCTRISNKSDWTFTSVRANRVITNMIGSTSIWGLAFIQIYESKVQKKFPHMIQSNKQADNGQALKKANPSAGNRELN